MVTGDITKMVTQVIPDFAPRHKNTYTRKRPLREFWNTKGRLKHPSAPPLPLALVSPVGKTARVASKLPNIVGHVLEPQLGSGHTRISGDLRSLTTGNLIMREEEEGVATTSSQILAARVPTCSA